MSFSANPVLGTVEYVGTDLPIRVVRTQDAADHTNNDNTLKNDDTLTFPIGVNQRVIGELVVAYYAHADKDFQNRLVGPTGSTFVWGYDGSNNADVEVSNAGETSNNTVTFTESTSSSDVGFLKMSFIIENGSTAGTVSYQWAAAVQVDNDAERVYVKAGSHIRYQYF
tara:strand:- start:53 stop:556 length:504 start_codon:yes stop_codon:yes gene_type:complete